MQFEARAQSWAVMIEVVEEKPLPNLVYLRRRQRGHSQNVVQAYRLNVRCVGTYLRYPCLLNSSFLAILLLPLLLPHHTWDVFIRCSSKNLLPPRASLARMALVNTYLPRCLGGLRTTSYIYPSNLLGHHNQRPRTLTDHVAATKTQTSNRRGP